MSKDREIKEAIDAMWSYPAEVADNYDAWLMMGQCLHSVDESLLEEWDKWSQQSDKYKDGDCHRRWLSFSKEGGRGAGTLFYGAKEHGWTPSQDHKHSAPDMEMINLVETMSKENNEASLAEAIDSLYSPTGTNAAQQTTVNSLFQVPQKPKIRKVEMLLLMLYQISCFKCIKEIFDFLLLMISSLCMLTRLQACGVS